MSLRSFRALLVRQVRQQRLLAIQRNLDRLRAEYGALAAPLDFVSAADLLMVQSLISQIITEDVKGHWSQYQSLGCSTSDWPAAGVHVADYKPLSLAVQPDSSPYPCPLT